MLANANVSNVGLLIFPRSVVTCFPIINPILLLEFGPGEFSRQNVACSSHLHWPGCTIA